MVKVTDLKGLDIFSEFTKKQLEALSKLMQEKSYKSSDRIYSGGDPANYFFIITHGCVNLVELKEDDKLGIRFEKLKKGDVFGCGIFMKPMNYTLTAVCKEDCKVLVIEAGKLLQLCKTDPQMGFKLMKKIANIYMQRFNSAKRQLHQVVQSVSLYGVII